MDTVRHRISPPWSLHNFYMLLMKLYLSRGISPRLTNGFAVHHFQGRISAACTTGFLQAGLFVGRVVGCMCAPHDPRSLDNRTFVNAVIRNHSEWVVCLNSMAHVMILFEILTIVVLCCLVH